MNDSAIFSYKSYVEVWSTFQDSLFEVWSIIGAFLPNFIVATLVFIVCLLIGVLLSRGIEYVFQKTHLEHIFDKFGVHEAVCRTGMPCNIGKFIGETVKWCIIVVAGTASLSVVGLSDVKFILINFITGFLPNVITAAFIILIAALIGRFMQKVVVAVARLAHVHAAHLIGSLTKWTIWIFAGTTALLYLDVTASLLQYVFIGVVVAAALGAGIALGLGGKETAKSFLEHAEKDVKGHH